MYQIEVTKIFLLIYRNCDTSAILYAQLVVESKKAKGICEFFSVETIKPSKIGVQACIEDGFRIIGIVISGCCHGKSKNGDPVKNG